MSALANRVDFTPGIPTQLVTRRLPQVPDFHYLLQLSDDPDPSRVLVLVHGVSRRSTYMMRCMEARARALNYSLLAPVFNPRSYGDYQRLGRSGRSERADLAFDAMLEDVAEITGLDVPVHLFGFSGGAQFGHRYALCRAARIRSLHLAAAGWYTMLDDRRRFPHGTAPSRRLPGVRFDTSGLLSAPIQLLVGERDTNQGRSVRNTQRLDTCQGRHRLARARWFHDQLLRLAEQQSISPQYRLVMLPKTAHDFGQAVLRGGLVDHVFDFCENVIQ